MGDQLASNGGKLTFTDEWARRWLKQHGYVRRQATQPKEKKVTARFQELTFKQEITQEIIDDFKMHIAMKVKVF